MLVTSLRCWWPVQDVGDRFRMLVTDLIHWENHQHHEKSLQHNDSATNISNQSPSESHQHNDVTNITVTHIYSLYIGSICRETEFLEILFGTHQIQPMYMMKLDGKNWTVWDSVSRIELYTCEDKLWGMHFWHFSHCWQWRDRCFLNRLPVIMLVVWHSDRHLKNGFIENIK